eukprot:Unigene12428_Nuclearia_a/m.37768 Unigene12428_Nuclearia_a/g.37768  ORF Unigene12428_Nuclearia_a/g.37768 Unigene12428_Nuclearia_a/m.37768 type:complete len:305 (-) Unigene12428_Nuclearia_a:11-925(-)
MALGSPVTLHDVKTCLLALDRQQTTALACQATGTVFSPAQWCGQLENELVDRVLTNPLQLASAPVGELPLERTLRRAWQWADEWIPRKGTMRAAANRGDAARAGEYREVYEDTLLLALWGAVVAAKIFQGPFLQITAIVDLPPLSRLTLEILQHMALTCRLVVPGEPLEAHIQRLSLRPDASATLQLFGEVVLALGHVRAPLMAQREAEVFAHALAAQQQPAAAQIFTEPVRAVLELRLLDIYEALQRALPPDNDLLDRVIALAYLDATRIVRFVLASDEAGRSAGVPNALVVAMLVLAAQTTV